MNEDINEINWLFPEEEPQEKDAFFEMFQDPFGDANFDDPWDFESSEATHQPIDKTPEIPQIDYDNLGEITSDNFWYFYNRGTEEEQRKLLNNPQSIKYLQDFLLEEADYEHYERLFRLIDPKETIHIFTPEFIKKYISTINKYNQYKLFATMFNDTKERNQLLDKIMQNEELFIYFANQHHYLYSAVILDKEHYLKLIRKIEQDNLYSEFSMLHIDRSVQEDLLQEEYILKTLNWLLDKMSKEVKSSFYSTDKRAPMTIEALKKKVSTYIEHGIKYGTHVIKHPKFFEILKSSSLLEFRQRINTIEDNCNDPHYIETKLQQYYESMISSYNPETKMFSCYDEILSDEEKYYSSPNDDYLINSELKWTNGFNKEKYIKTTNHKLSELIVDYLFQDTLYNVWHNINQLIKYMDSLDENEYPVPKEHLRFYELILRIDKISPEEKIQMFNKLKDKNIHVSFYEDMRRTKDLAYEKIKTQMIDPTNPIYENQALTEKYHHPTMDLREEQYFMLVRTMNSFYRENDAVRAGSSYTLISNENTSTFQDDNIIYGYISFDIDKVEHMFDFDSFSSAFDGSLNNTQGTTNHVNQILTAEELANSPGYSEVILKNNQIAKGKFDEIKPDFVVVKGEPTPRDIKAAQQLNIPIVIIKPQLSYGGSHFVMDESEKYTNGSYHEQERLAKRQ